MKIPQELDTRAFRREFGLSQDAFARLLNVPIYPIAGWESRGAAAPAAVELLRIRLPQIRLELARRAAQTDQAEGRAAESGGGE